MKYIGLLIVTCWMHTVLFAQKKIEFSPACFQAYLEISKLKIKLGQQSIDKIKISEPDNAAVYLLEDYIDFYTLFINEDQTQYQTLFPRFQERLDALQSANRNTPFYLYAQALVRLHRAGVAVKFGHLWDAGWDFKKAYAQLKENKKLYPQFTPNDLLFGSLKAVAGTTPKNYRWLANFLGIKGSIQEGMKTVRQFAYSNDPWARTFFNDAAFIYPYLLFHIENKKEEALQFIQQKKLDLVNNHLHAFMACNLALNNKQAELTKNIISNRNKSDDYMPLSVWDFEMGYTKMYHLELGEAIKYFESFTRNFKGHYYLKDVYQKISWCYYLQNNSKAAEQARKMVISKGTTESDADKKAYRDAKAAYWPNPLLLKARLLSDGGYHSEAYKLLSGKTIDQFETEGEKLEFAYRVARILDDSGRADDAIRNYLIAIRLGENRREQYAARAALQIAQIYEQRQQKDLAIQYYQQCLNMDDHEYKDSLDQKAKAGIARCKGE